MKITPHQFSSKNQTNHQLSQWPSIIHDHLCRQMRLREITPDKATTFMANEFRYQDALRDTKERLKVKLTTGRCSDFLVQQVAGHRAGLGEAFTHKMEFYNASEICDLIGLLEEGKVAGEKFNGLVLKGYHHIHHGTYAGLGYSIARNIKEYWFKNGKIRKERLEDYRMIVEKNGAHGLRAVMNDMHTKAMGERGRNGALKGEWLIYKIVNDCNYYLCLATHEEGDQKIYDSKILPSFPEFPELKN